jgi:hypothetical protein
VTGPQVEVLVIMGHLFRRTLVMPDHLTSSMDHLHAFGRQQLADFFDFHDLSTWVPAITMQQYLDVRCATPRRGSASWSTMPSMKPSIPPCVRVQGIG